jgi:hypothetical protein
VPGVVPHTGGSDDEWPQRYRTALLLPGLQPCFVFTPPPFNVLPRCCVVFTSLVRSIALFFLCLNSFLQLFWNDVYSSSVTPLLAVKRLHWPNPRAHPPTKRNRPFAHSIRMGREREDKKCGESFMYILT